MWTLLGLRLHSVSVRQLCKGVQCLSMNVMCINLHRGTTSQAYAWGDTIVARAAISAHGIGVCKCTCTAVHSYQGLVGLRCSCPGCPARVVRPE